MIVLLAIAASIVSNTADAKARHARQQTIIACNDRGCSDHLVTQQMAPINDMRASTRVRREINRSTKARRTVALKRRRVQEQTFIACDDRGCSDYPRGRAAQAEVSRSDDAFATVKTPRAMRTRTAAANGNAVILGGRPAGCPHRFCGCEASRYVFGRIRPELNLAANWIKYFPRTVPAPGMAAARGGHVMVLISQIDAGDWLVHDGNSGGGLTRRHVRSIRGYVIVDPHGSRSARLYSNGVSARD